MKTIFKRIALFIFSFVIVATALAVLIPLFIDEPNFDVSMVSIAISGLLCITLVLLPVSLIKRSGVKRLLYITTWLAFAVFSIIWTIWLIVDVFIMSLIFNKETFDKMYKKTIDWLSDYYEHITKLQ